MRLSSRCRPGLVALAAALLLAGCGKQTTLTEEEEKRGNPLFDTPQPGATGVRRAYNRTQVGNDLKQIALLYEMYRSDTRKYPTKVETFIAYLDRGDTRHLAKALKDGRYVLVLTKAPNSNTVLVYEKDADGYGMHQVAMGDQRVDSMSTQDLQQALKNPGG